ncbi:MAG: tripartite tricarboxylate transporter substrate binding protein, partial [Oscillospiraceae bacterium]
MKKFLSLILALGMVLSMAACGAEPAAPAADPAAPAVVDFSDKSVTCVVPYDAGGGTDAVMRGIADAAKGSFKNITVENRSGAGGATGMLYGANAAADGSIVTMVTVELATLEA